MKDYDGLDVWNPPIPDTRNASRSHLVSQGLNWAILAPSSHNAQPWSFRQEDETVSVLADRSKRLPIVDPDDRELIMGCAAAATHLDLALTRFGLKTIVDWLPERGRPDVVARLDVVGADEPTTDEVVLFEAITRRATNRAPFRQIQVPVTTLVRAKFIAESNGVHLTVLTRGDRKPVADLIARGDRIQMADKAFRHELASWLHHNRSELLDGMRGYAFGIGDLVSHAGPTVLRTFDAGKGQAARDHELATHSPALFVLETDGDEPSDWVKAGRVMDLILLRLTAEGFAASFLNQPIEVPPLRQDLAKLLRSKLYPQILLRVGEPTEKHPPEPRRPVASSDR